MNIQELRDKLSEKRGQAKQIQNDLEKATANCQIIEKEISYSERAQSIISTVAEATQRELEYRICEPVSLALAAVYDDPYKLSADFNITGRGNTECHQQNPAV